MTVAPQTPPEGRTSCRADTGRGVGGGGVRGLPASSLARHLRVSWAESPPSVPRSVFCPSPEAAAPCTAQPVARPAARPSPASGVGNAAPHTPLTLTRSHCQGTTPSVHAQGLRNGEKPAPHRQPERGPGLLLLLLGGGHPYLPAQGDTLPPLGVYEETEMLTTRRWRPFHQEHAHHPSTPSTSITYTLSPTSKDSTLTHLL